MYCRKSTDSEDRQVQSIPDQKRELQPLITSRGLKVIKIFGESMSAKKPGRPDFNEMIAMLEQGKADGVLCWKINRLARNPIDGGKIQWLLQQGIIKSIITPGREYMPADNVLMMAVELGMATQYSLDLGKDVKRGMKSKVLKGWKPVKAPLGYLNDPHGEKGNKKIFIDPDRFPLVRKMWDMLLSGAYSVPKIISIVNNEWGMRTRQGNKIGPGPAYKMFKNTFYYGEYFYDGEIRKGSHESLITQEEYDRAQKILGKAGKPRPKYKRLPFNGVISCGECGCMITSEEKFKFIISEGVRRSYIYHRCTKRKLDTYCSQPSIKHEELAKQIKDYLDSITIPQEFLKWAIEVLKSNNEVEETNREVAIKNLRTGQASCLKRMDNLIDLYTSPENVSREMLTEDEFKSRKKSLMEEKARIEAEISKAEQGMSVYAELTEKTFNFATHAKVWFEKGDYEKKTQILQAIGKNFTLSDGKLHIDLLEPLLVIKKASESGIFKIGRLELKRFSLSPQESIAFFEQYKQKTPQNVRCFLWSG